MKAAMVISVLSMMAFSAQATVYNCKLVDRTGWENAPADFLNVRVDTDGKKATVDLNADAFDVYKSCGKSIGRFTEKNLKKGPKGEVTFAKEWTYSDQIAEDTVTFYTPSLELPENVKIYWASSCVEGEFEFDLKCKKGF